MAPGWHGSSYPITLTMSLNVATDAKKTFFHATDYTTYLELLATFSREAGTEIWAYCLMPNHVHLVMVPSEEDGLRGVLGEAQRRYIRYINFREGWCGHLWQERFHSFVMDEHYLMATVRYVERNPVVASFPRKSGSRKSGSGLAFSLLPKQSMEQSKQSM